MKTYLVSVITEDRIGIIRDVTGALKKAGANLIDLRQNVIRGVFTLHCVAEFAKEWNPGPEPLIADETAQISVREMRNPHGPSSFAGEHYVIAVVGKDKPGRINLITTVIAKYNANVVDWRHDLSDATRPLTIGMVTIPPKTDVRALDEELRKALAPHNLTVSLRHENIFRAINDVCPIDALFAR